MSEPWPDWPLRDEDRATFLTLDRPTRHLILRLIGITPDGEGHRPTAADWDELARHPQAQVLASWLGTHPAYREARFVTEDEDEDEALFWLIVDDDDEDDGEATR